MRRLVFLFVLLPAFLPGCRNNPASKTDQLIIFHAGSLSVPFKMLADDFEEKNPGLKILMEPAGSLVCARKITELKKPCDIIASADYFVINQLIVPEYASWSIRFATNEIVIAFSEKSKYAGEINSQNWIDILLKKDVIYARSDPDSDPCGYRSVLTFKLAEDYYHRPLLADELQQKDRSFIRPKEVDLVALIESNAVDYMFQYKSVAIQHNLLYIELPDEINLGNPSMNGIYSLVHHNVTGSKPGSSMRITGEYINYSLSVLKNAPNSSKAVEFVEFIISPEGMDIFRKSGQDPIIPFSTEQPDLLPWNLKKHLK
ncbi:MAG TPA: tungstate ABC transporter substrate-binding protein WtpA [Bacteroidales bacterium]|nr:tungstate ABC transporter substrate-binding protein WtpA [Bacteroidales bacterium]